MCWCNPEDSQHWCEKPNCKPPKEKMARTVKVVLSDRCDLCGDLMAMDDDAYYLGEGRLLCAECGESKK